jgi:pathogenesis-related protein 1
MRKILTLLLLLLSFVAIKAQNKEDFKNKILERHNYYRSQQGASNLVWSDELANAAQQWANKLAKKDKMFHSTMSYGENIYWGYSDDPTRAVDLWADEATYYPGEAISENNFHLFGHYTQLIWAATTKVGCAEAISKTGKHYIVCEYDPAGNIIGEKPVKNYKDKTK